MNPIQTLEQLLKNDVLVEVNETIEELKTQQLKQNNKNTQEELDYMQQVQQYFNEVIEDIHLGNLSTHDAIDILESLEEMKNEDDPL